MCVVFASNGKSLAAHKNAGHYHLVEHIPVALKLICAHTAIFLKLSEKIIQRQWKSKYNDYIAYDYAPFCIGGFNLLYTIDFSLSSHLLEYYKFLVEKRLNQINELEKLLLLEV